jgi:hypothetical protein
MNTSTNNTKVVKDNWDDSSESEQEEGEEQIEQTMTNDINNSVDILDANQDETDKTWDFYEGFASCVNCGKSSEARIIMIESKSVFCYDTCVYNENDGYDDDYDDGYDDGYDELDDYDRKLGLSVSCR